MSTRPAWSRIVLKLSGEALAEPSGFGLDSGVLSQVAEEVREAREELGTDIAIVVGGGNFWRGLKGAGQGMDQAQADYMGMLATVMNGLALQDALERAGQNSRVMSAIEMPKIAEPYIRRRAERHLEKGRVVILAGGTGNPFFTTDTAAALRAADERHRRIVARNREQEERRRQGECDGRNQSIAALVLLPPSVSKDTGANDADRRRQGRHQPR